jgi:FkbM family methyltransferase
MSMASRIRHSFVGYYTRRAIHTLYRRKHLDGKPVDYHISPGVDIRLYPEGEVAEFLAFPRLFERTELALVSAHLKPGMRVVDVGANIGLYSILAQKLVGSSGAVWAFEPSAESFGRLNRNLSLNGCAQVHPFQLALSDKVNTTLELRSDKGYGDAYRYLVATQETASGDHKSSGSVSVTTLDSWAASNGVNRIDFLKVDIEGGEFRMFMGAQKLLEASRSVVVLFESESDWCKRAGCSQDDSFKLLERLGLRLFTLGKGKAKKWVSDRQSLLNSGMVWACRDADMLPVLDTME